MSEELPKNKPMGLYDIINLDVHQNFFPKRKKEISNINSLKEDSFFTLVYHIYHIENTKLFDILLDEYEKYNNNTKENKNQYYNEHDNISIKRKLN